MLKIKLNQILNKIYGGVNEFDKLQEQFLKTHLEFILVEEERKDGVKC